MFVSEYYATNIKSPRTAVGLIYKQTQVSNPDGTGVKSSSQPDVAINVAQITMVEIASANTPTANELDALWDKSFAATQDLLSKLGYEAHLEYLAGTTEDFDFDLDTDVP